MIKVKNRQAIRSLSRKSLKANRLRNTVAVFAIALTTILFTALFTIGGSLLLTVQEETMRQVGTKAHGGFKSLTQSQYDILKEDPKLKDISYDILVGFANNPELNKTMTEIRYTEEKKAEWSFSAPTTGRLPESGMEIATTTAVLDALGVPHSMGAQVPLSFSVNGIQYDEVFTLCGYWEMDIALGVSEAYVSREYSDRVAPVLTIPPYEMENFMDFYPVGGGINSNLWFASSFDLDGQMEALKERCGFDEKVNKDVNWAYMTDTVDLQGVLLVIALLLVILTSGYLIIYNVFYISVSRDIRYYGLLKTIGTTGRQLKRIVHQQAFLLSVIGIPLGMAAGYGCGGLLVPVIMNITYYRNGYVLSVNPLIFVGAALFSLFTVWISCIRPCRLAAKVSPVEAVRYTGVEQSGKKETQGKRKKKRRVTPYRMASASLAKDWKKAASVVLSLSLSLILFVGTDRMVNGFDMDTYLSDSILTDFLLTDATVVNLTGNEITTEGVTEAALANIAALPGVTEVGSVYMQRQVHTFSEEGRQKALQVLEKNRERLPTPYADENVRMLEEENQVMTKLYGVDKLVFDKLELPKGETVDWETFATGDYVIVTPFWDTKEDRCMGEDRYYDVGDRVTIDFGNGNTKDYTVLAIGSVPYAMGPRYGNYLGCDFTLPAEEYCRQTGKKQPLSTGFNVEEEYIGQTEEWMKEYCEKVEPNLIYETKAMYEEEFKTMTTMIALVGGALSFILALIGILNFMNAMVTSIFTRRREFAMLQSVGMTGKQLRQMLVEEGLLYVGITVLFTLTVGNVLVYLAIKGISAGMWFFTYHFSILPFLYGIPVLILMAVFIPVLACRSLVKKSVVERLRETE